MDAETLDNFAKSLAVCAVTGDRSGLEKHAAGFLNDMYAKAQPYLADPYIRNSLLGLGAGGLVGLTQPKRKLRNALTYGLLGGLGGFGATHFFNQLPGNAKSAPDAEGGAGVAAAPGSAQAQQDFVDKTAPYNPSAGRLIGQGAGLVTGTVGGSYFGAKALKAREGIQNLLATKTDALGPSGQAAQQAVRAVRAALPNNASQNQQRAFFNSATQADPNTLRGGQSLWQRLRSRHPQGWTARGQVAQQLAQNAAAAVHSSAIRPNTNAIASAAKVVNPRAFNGLTAKDISRAISDANHAAPTRLRHRVGGGLIGLGAGLGLDYLGGAVGENLVNGWNRPYQQAAVPR